MSTVIHFNQLKLKISGLTVANRHGNINDEEYALIKKSVYNLLEIPYETKTDIRIKSKSIDARKGHDICYTYTLDVFLDYDIKILPGKLKNKAYIVHEKRKSFSPYLKTKKEFKGIDRPVVVGAGPAGLFAAYILALNGANPLLIERGSCIEDRINDVNEFWKNPDKLNVHSNVCFGEGGAGTFSDGKLNTSVKDTFGRIEFVKKVFTEHGAPEEIMYMKKPHIGTDRLRDVIINMRNSIIKLGGTVMFDTMLSDIITDDNGLSAIHITKTKTNEKNIIPCRSLILAIGHSARDTYEMLSHKLKLEKKDFAVGLRIQHRQEYIDRLQYKEYAAMLPPADYSVRYHTKAGRAVYSFCMCPGGYVVNASTEKGRLVINGMSNYDRDSYNANSAIVVNVTSQDFDSDDVLAGINFQRKLEELAYKEGNGNIPCQILSDYKNNITGTEKHNSITPVNKGSICFANLRNILPDYINEAIIEAMDYFESIMPGFGSDNVLMCGVETRTSSPVRIVRDSNMQSDIHGIIPCGEGAGYAGGIMSAAVDGIKAAFSLLDLI